jgi:hypothetical protein
MIIVNKPNERYVDLVYLDPIKEFNVIDLVTLSKSLILCNSLVYVAMGERENNNVDLYANHLEKIMGNMHTCLKYWESEKRAYSL